MPTYVEKRRLRERIYLPGLEATAESSQRKRGYYGTGASHEMQHLELPPVEELTARRSVYPFWVGFKRF
jgi:hypothetical protein